MKDHEKEKIGNRTDRDNQTTNYTDTSNLVRLKDADDLKIVKDDPDVRGWPLLTADNMEVGKVDELIVDTRAMKVRYMVIDLYDDYAADKLDHYMLLPIGAARLHEKDNKVMVSGIKTTTVLNYPVYRNETITRDYERSLRAFFERGGTAAGATGTAGTSMDGRTIVETEKGQIYGHATDRADREPVRPEENEIPGERGHLQNPDRMDDNARMETDTIRGDRASGERYRTPDVGQKPFGQPNWSTPADFNERSQTSGLTPRTTNLENKELKQGPSGTEKTEWDAQRPHRQEGEWNETSNLNSSTSLSSDTKRGSNLGNAENRPQYKTDRERAASPEHVTRRPGETSTDDFYNHDHFDEEVFFHARRKRRD